MDFTAKYNLGCHLRLNSEVVSAAWLEETGTYTVKINKNGELIEDWCHILVNAQGTLNKWKWPDIKGLQSFRGTLLHSARWNENTDYADKTVAVIGTGSSAIQIVPKIQPQVRKLITFMRSVTWIAPPIASDILEQAQIDAGESRSLEQHLYTPQEIRRFRDHPEEHLAYRKELESRFNNMFEMFLSGSRISKATKAYMEATMLRRIGPGFEDLKAHLIPTWSPGCRRLTPGDGYLEALTQANVVRVHDEIKEITSEGLVDTNGNLHQADIIVCATGFDVSFKPSFNVVGVNGLDMSQAFTPMPKVYLSMTAPGFPNYFTINGFRGSWATGTALNAHEACVNYVVSCIKRLQSEHIRAIEVKSEAVDALYEHIDEWHKRSVWNEPCKRQVPVGMVPTNTKQDFS